MYIHARFQPHHAEDKIYDGCRITGNTVLIHQKFWYHIAKFYVKHPPYLWILHYYDAISGVMHSDS